MAVDTIPSPVRSDRFYVFLILLITLGFRIVHLDADPPWDFSWSGGYFADEGFWAHNARNEVLFGQRVMDEWDAAVVSPIFANAQRLAFRLFGVGLIQARLIGLFSSFLIAVSTFSVLRRRLDAPIAVLISFVITLAYPMLVLGRQGILDPFAAALAWLAFALVLGNSRGAALLAGVFLMGSVITKYLMIYTLIPFSWLLLQKERKHQAAFAVGFSVACVLWLFAVYLPHRKLLHAYSNFYSSQQSWQVGDVLKNVFLQPFYLYFSKSPVILFFGNLMLWRLIIVHKEKEQFGRSIAIWLLTGLFFFAVWRYRPFRYYTSLLPPLGCLAGLALLQFNDVVLTYREAKKWRRLFLWAAFAVPAVQLLYAAADAVFGWGRIPAQLGLQAPDLLIFLALTAFFVVAVAQLRTMKPAVTVAMFALCFLLSDFRSYLGWIMQPRYSAVVIADDLTKRVGNGVVTGQWAPELCLENRLRAVPVWHGFVNSEDPFRRYGITHVLQWKYPLGGEKFELWYPQEFQNFKPIITYRIKHSDLVLFEKHK